MPVMVDVKSGKVSEGCFRERLAVRLCLFTSLLFAPLKFRGFWRITNVICRVFGITKRQWVTLPNGVKFSIDLNDPYWNRMLSPAFEYEPELIFLLEQLKGTNYSFIDCGANMGYWTCLAASPVFGQKPVYAIEPLSNNFQLIEQHAERNNLPVHLYKNAISNQNGQSVPLFKPGSHASVSLVSNKTDETPEEVVQTITIDSIYNEHLQNNHNIFLKLDVEGVEIQALKGATELLETKKPLILYEDHSDDSASLISEYVLNKMGYKVLFIDAQLRCREITCISEVNKIKVIANHGYNFLAFHPESVFAKQVVNTIFEN